MRLRYHDIRMELTNTVGILKKGLYPSYVMNGRLNTDELPVFVYHRVDAADFERQLRYLRANGYRTLDTESPDLSQNQDDGSYARKVMITFDDGLDDLYTVAYPLLSTYGFKGVAFISPFWIGESGVVTWEQVEEMHSSGCMDFQSHSYTHMQIFTSPQVVDFFHPGCLKHPRWDFPLLIESDGTIGKSWPDWGTPIYRSESGLSDSPRYLGDTDLETACTDRVASGDGDSFFRKRRWRSELDAVVQKYIGSDSIRVFESEEEQLLRIKNEITVSKAEIENRLNKPVTAFAYPRFEQGAIADRILKDAGYRLVFGGLAANTGVNPGEGHLRYLRRVNGDFVGCLSGRGRQTVGSVLLKKIARRATLSFR